MKKLNLIIVDASGCKKQKAELPESIKIDAAAAELSKQINMPAMGPDGEPISYKFTHKASGRQLSGSRTLKEAGIKDGDVLRVQPQLTAAVTCPNCGAEVQDGMLFCSECGSRINTEPEQNGGYPPEPNNDPAGSSPINGINNGYLTGTGKPQTIDKILKPQIKDKIFDILGMVTGILSVIIGITFFSGSYGVHVTSQSYGGDAYTGIQNAVAYTGNNVRALAKLLKSGFAWILIIIGLAIIFYFASRFISRKNK